MWQNTLKGGQGGIPTCKFKNVTAILESCHIQSILIYVGFRIKFEWRKLLKSQLNLNGWIVAGMRKDFPDTFC